MYNADDAVARIDSLHRSASPAAAPFVGERKLVRIEQVERAAAVASLVDGVPEAAAGDEGDEEG